MVVTRKPEGVVGRRVRERSPAAQMLVSNACPVKRRQ